MTEDLFFDTDCLSSFLWINDTNILQELYGGKIVIPDPVYQEMSNPCIPHIKKRADALLDKSEGVYDEVIEAPDRAGISAGSGVVYVVVIIWFLRVPLGGRFRRLVPEVPHSWLEVPRLVSVSLSEPVPAPFPVRGALCGLPLLLRSRSGFFDSVNSFSQISFQPLGSR